MGRTTPAAYVPAITWCRRRDPAGARQPPAPPDLLYDPLMRASKDLVVILASVAILATYGLWQYKSPEKLASEKDLHAKEYARQKAIVDDVRSLRQRSSGLFLSFRYYSSADVRIVPRKGSGGLGV